MSSPFRLRTVREAIDASPSLSQPASPSEFAGDMRSPVLDPASESDGDGERKYPFQRRRETNRPPAPSSRCPDTPSSDASGIEEDDRPARRPIKIEARRPDREQEKEERAQAEEGEERQAKKRGEKGKQATPQEVVQRQKALIENEALQRFLMDHDAVKKAEITVKEAKSRLDVSKRAAAALFKDKPKDAWKISLDILPPEQVEKMGGGGSVTYGERKAPAVNGFVISEPVIRGAVLAGMRTDTKLSAEQAHRLLERWLTVYCSSIPKESLRKGDIPMPVVTRRYDRRPGGGAQARKRALAPAASSSSSSSSKRQRSAGLGEDVENADQVDEDEQGNASAKKPPTKGFRFVYGKRVRLPDAPIKIPSPPNGDGEMSSGGMEEGSSKLGDFCPLPPNSSAAPLVFGPPPSAPALTSSSSSSSASSAFPSSAPLPFSSAIVPSSSLPQPHKVQDAARTQSSPAADSPLMPFSPAASSPRLDAIRLPPSAKQATSASKLAAPALPATGRQPDAASSPARASASPRAGGSPSSASVGGRSPEQFGSVSAEFR